jgi:hypothetical protein
MKRSFLTGVAAAALLATSSYAALAAGKKGKVEAAPPPPPAWLDTLTIDGFVEGGVTINPGQPVNKVNWGHLYTDRANWPTFNGALLTVQRPLDPKAEGIDLGFKVQGQVGMDARYNHFLGVLDYAVKSRTQIALIEAHGLVHLPILTKGGIDLKIGKFVTYNGAEVIPAKDNLFYTHSYIFNFGPFLHTGAMATTHVTDWLDVYTGVTTGVNTSIGWPGDNNRAASFHGGFGLNLLDGQLTIMAFTHAGPENPKMVDPYLNLTFPAGVPHWPDIGTFCSCGPSTTWRYYNNLTATWKPTENLTLITDISYMRDDGWNAVNGLGMSQAYAGWVDGLLGTPFGLLPRRPRGVDAYGVAQYASYKVNDQFKVNGRIEYWRDNNNFFAGAFPGYFDMVNAMHGFQSAAIFQPFGNANNANGTSYLALTLGTTITPDVPDMPLIKGIILRPEVRWDVAVNNAAPFFGGPRTSVPYGLTASPPPTIGVTQKRSQGLIAMDVIIPFSIR